MVDNDKRCKRSRTSKCVRDREEGEEIVAVRTSYKNGLGKLSFSVYITLKWGFKKLYAEDSSSHKSMYWCHGYSVGSVNSYYVIMIGNGLLC